MRRTLLDESESLPTKNLKKISMYVPPEVYSALEQWADEEDRTLSNLCGRICAQALEQKQGKQQDGQQSDGEAK